MVVVSSCNPDGPSPPPPPPSSSSSCRRTVASSFRRLRCAARVIGAASGDSASSLSSPSFLVPCLPLPSSPARACVCAREFVVRVLPLTCRSVLARWRRVESAAVLAVAAVAPPPSLVPPLVSLSTVCSRFHRCLLSPPLPSMFPLFVCVLCSLLVVVSLAVTGGHVRRRFASLRRSLPSRARLPPSSASPLLPPPALVPS